MTVPIPGPCRPAPVPVSEVEALQRSRRNDLDIIARQRAELDELRTKIWRVRRGRRILRAEVAHLKAQLAQARTENNA